MADLPISADATMEAAMLSLWGEAESIWDKMENEPGFEAYVSADYRLVFQALQKLRGRAETFLEWGSGLGVVTMMASRLGFDAYGLETSPALVEYSRKLAAIFAPKARFEIGSFVPQEYEWNPALGDDGLRTDFDTASGYDSLGMDLADFDLVYAYPWPDEHDVYRDIVRQFGSSTVILLTYDAREGIGVHRFSKKNRKRRSG